jgi:hypothetical protein
MTAFSPNVNPRLNGMGFPSSWMSRGLGSNVSMLEGPPCMNSTMMRFALAGKWGRFGASADTGSALSDRSG